MPFDPQFLHLDELLGQPDMFDSRRAWRRAGFEVLDPAKESECMVAAHAAAPGYLFKKYANTVSTREQRENYATRVAGSERLARFIADEHLQHVVVPRKYLHEASLVLVVERMDVLGKDASARQYHDIAEPVLRELLRVLVQWKGLDSNSKNVQFTRDGKIAFVDLEHWDRTDRDRVRLKSIGDYLSKDRRKLAKRILDELE